jgi:hypothetical protein
MRQRNRWLRLTLVLACVLTLFGNVGVSAADNWQMIDTPGQFRTYLAGQGDGQTLVAAPAERAELRAQAATINVVYEGFSAEAQASFQAAVNIWQGLLNASIPIRVKATWTPLDEGVLGGARAAGFLFNTGTKTYYPVALGQQLANTDPNPNGFDIEAVFNSSGVSWYYGTGQAPSGQYNLASVVLHELGHGLGFADSFIVDGGVGAYGDDDGNPLIFDRFVVNAQGANFANPSTALAAQLQSNGLFFNGAQTRAANGGTPPRLYAPNPYEQGSSVAHFDEDTYGPGNPNSLMTPFLDDGESIYNPGPFTLGLFADLGWSVVTAPAPSPSPSPVPSPSPSASPSPVPSPSPSASPTPRPSPSPAPSAPPSPVPSPPTTGTGGNLPGLPNTGDGSMSGGQGQGGQPAWLFLLPFLALGAGYPVARYLRRRTF